MAKKVEDYALACKVYKAIAADLKEFGYPSVTWQMIEEIHVAQINGETLPHGVIGRFAESHLEEATERGLLATTEEGV